LSKKNKYSTTDRGVETTAYGALGWRATLIHGYEPPPERPIAHQDHTGSERGTGLVRYTRPSRTSHTDTTYASSPTRHIRIVALAAAAAALPRFASTVALVPAPASRCTPRHHPRSSRSLPLTTVLWFSSVVDFPPPRHHPRRRPRHTPPSPARRAALRAELPTRPRHRLAIRLHRHHSHECVCACSHMHPNASVFTSEIAPHAAPRAPRAAAKRALLFTFYRTGVQH
jgi:hypothetical protein